MTAKQVRCNRWKTCKQKECPEYKEHDFCDPICLAAYCRLVDESAWCIPVKPRKPSPAKKPVQGKDVYKWVFKFNKMNGGFYGSYLFDEKPIGLYSIGKYVRVKLTEVK